MLYYSTTWLKLQSSEFVCIFYVDSMDEKHWQTASGVHHPRLLYCLQKFMQKSLQCATLIQSLAENRRMHSYIRSLNSRKLSKTPNRWYFTQLLYSHQKYSQHFEIHFNVSCRNFQLVHVYFSFESNVSVHFIRENSTRKFLRKQSLFPVNTLKIQLKFHFNRLHRGIFVDWLCTWLAHRMLSQLQTAIFLRKFYRQISDLVEQQLFLTNYEIEKIQLELRIDFFPSIGTIQF